MHAACAAKQEIRNSNVEGNVKRSKLKSVVRLAFEFGISFRHLNFDLRISLPGDWVRPIASKGFRALHHEAIGPW